MGNFESSMSNIMDHEDSDSSEDIEIGYDMLNLYLDHDSNESDYNSHEDLLNILLQRFINTDHLHFRSSNQVQRSRFRMPQIKAKLNLDTLKKNHIYQSIKQSSGMDNGTNDSNSMNKWSLVRMLNDRQSGIGQKDGAFTQQQRCKISNNFLPNESKNLFSYEKKIFCGSLTNDGKYFVTASQDSIIRVYDATTPKYAEVNVINAKDVNWCISDVAFSPSGEHLVYSTWSTCLYLSRLHGASLEIQPLFLNPNKQSNCIFSVAFTSCGKNVIGGATDGCLYTYDLESKKRLHPVQVGSEDVNSVGFVDDTSNIIFTGSDSGVIKLWDRRCLNERHPKEVGVFVGHFDGVTYIDSKNDARYLISNSKDQTIKLWDMRVFSQGDSPSSMRRQTHLRWDYRWDDVPKEFYSDSIKLADDTSIMTYRGHRVKKTLIRAKFSPMETTGQRYIYTGCGTGRLIVYDILTGRIVHAKRAHNEIVRDVAWHPVRNEILSSSWDYNVCLHVYKQSKQSLLKRCFSEIDQTTDHDQARSRDDGQNAPPRRSRRLALRRQAQESN